MKAQQDVIDLLEEAHEMTVIRSTHYQQTLYRYHERKIRGRILEVSDLVLRMTQSTKDKHKLSPPWEGLYMLMEMGIPIFCQMVVTIVVAENDTPIWLQIERSNPAILAP